MENNFDYFDITNNIIKNMKPYKPYSWAEWWKTFVDRHVPEEGTMDYLLWKRDKRCYVKNAINDDFSQRNLLNRLIVSHAIGLYLIDEQTVAEDTLCPPH